MIVAFWLTSDGKTNVDRLPFLFDQRWPDGAGFQGKYVERGENNSKYDFVRTSFILQNGRRVLFLKENIKSEMVVLKSGGGGANYELSELVQQFVIRNP